MVGKHHTEKYQNGEQTSTDFAATQWRSFLRFGLPLPSSEQLSTSDASDRSAKNCSNMSDNDVFCESATSSCDGELPASTSTAPTESSGQTAGMSPGNASLGRATDGVVPAGMMPVALRRAQDLPTYVAIGTLPTVFCEGLNVNASGMSNACQNSTLRRALSTPEA
eukprot:11228363-Lingulodinium_polyedra.AAC.2